MLPKRRYEAQEQEGCGSYETTVCFSGCYHGSNSHNSLKMDDIDPPPATMLFDSNLTSAYLCSKMKKEEVLVITKSTDTPKQILLELSKVSLLEPPR